MAQKLTDVMGEEHSSSIAAMGALALARVKQGRLREAHVLYERATRSSARGLGKHHATTLDLRLGAVDALRQLGRHDEATAKGLRLLRAQRAAGSALRADEMRLARALELAAGPATAAGGLAQARLLQEAAEAQLPCN